MSVATPVVAFECPQCRALLQPQDQTRVNCPNCTWLGEAYLFYPLTVQADEAQDALPEGARCIHHPKEQVVAIRAGTGDYICARCAVDLNEKTCIAQYLSAAGKDKLGDSFDRYLDRPDRVVVILILLSLYIVYISPFTIPFAIYRFFRIGRLRRQDEVYRRLIGPGQVFVLGLMLVLMTLLASGMAAGIVAAIVAVVNS